MKKHLTFKDDKSDKFWSIETLGASFKVTYGKAGTDGQTSTKEFETEEKCIKEAEKLLSEKLQEGYGEDNTANTQDIFDAIRERDLSKFEKVLGSISTLDIIEEGQSSTPLSLAAYMKNAEMVKLLLKRGANVNFRTEHGRSALHDAAWHYDPEILTALCDAGADVNLTDHENWSPIFMTSEWEPFSMLLERGAKVDIVATTGETLIQRIATSFRRPDEGIKMLTRLVELGLDVKQEKPDENGETLLMEVIERGSTRKEKNIIAHFLLDQGMDPLAVSHVGVTPLHYACKSGDLDIVETLLALGANPNATVTSDWYSFNKGTLPIDLIKKHGSNYKSIKKLLSKVTKAKSTSSQPWKIDGENVIIKFAQDDFEAGLNQLILITSDIETNVFNNPDYTNPNEELTFCFESGENEIDESAFFSACVEQIHLRPQVVKYIEQIIKFNQALGGEPIYTHEELEAGGLAIEALLRTKEGAYLPLFLDYVKSIDLDHTVHFYDLISEVREMYDGKQLQDVETYLKHFKNF